jgi:hypothetical protein
VSLKERHQYLRVGRRRSISGEVRSEIALGDAVKTSRSKPQLAQSLHFMHYRTRVMYFGSPVGKEVAQVKLRRTVVVAAAAMFLISSGCTNGDAKKATDSPTTPGVATTISSVAGTPPPSVTAVDPVTAETANRRAVEAAWLNYWKIYLSLESAYPASQWIGVVAGIALNPIHDEIIQQASKDRAEGIVGYGYVVSHAYWPSSIGAKRSVVMGDCMDGSHAGSKIAKTNMRRTVGTPRTNVYATFFKGDDGRWRVRQIEYLKAPC